MSKYAEDPTGRSPRQGKKGSGAKASGKGSRPPRRPHEHEHDHDHDRIEGDRGRPGPRGSRDPREFVGGPEDLPGFDPRRGVHGHRRPSRGGGRARRGEVRNGMLALLAEGPKHGYQIIQELGERSGGAWTPSPGSVYPILHRLEGAGVVEVEDHDDGRRVFTLTPKGRLVIDRLDLESSPPWATMGPTESEEARELRRLAVQFDGAVGQVADVATPDQLTRAAAIVAEARRKLYALLAEEPVPEGSAPEESAPEGSAPEESAPEDPDTPTD